MTARLATGRAWIRWGIVLGFALGGFLDGILLHQILQWHHLLSLVPGMADLRTQVLWDGYFHALMYGVALAGLWGLWRARLDAPLQRGWMLVGALLIGFGLWHCVDAVLSHWILGIHRIRLDSPNVLLWDLIWLAGFGVVPALLGRLLLGRPHTPGGSVLGSTLSVLIAALLTTGLAAWSLQPPSGRQFTTIAFAPGVEPAQIFAAMRQVDARLVWSSPTMSVVVLDLEPARRWDFYRRGALLVSGAGLPAGCAGWSRA